MQRLAQPVGVTAQRPLLFIYIYMIFHILLWFFFFSLDHLQSLRSINKCSSSCILLHSIVVCSGIGFHNKAKPRRLWVQHAGSMARAVPNLKCKIVKKNEKKNGKCKIGKIKLFWALLWLISCDFLILCYCELT